MSPLAQQQQPTTQQKVCMNEQVSLACLPGVLPQPTLIICCYATKSFFFLYFWHQAPINLKKTGALCVRLSDNRTLKQLLPFTDFCSRRYLLRMSCRELPKKVIANSTLYVASDDKWQMWAPQCLERVKARNSSVKISLMARSAVFSCLGISHIIF